MRRIRVLVVVGAALALLVGLPGGPDRAGALGERHLPGGVFVFGCPWSHSRSDDPIVSPGRPGASHRHAFFGSRTASAHSTPATLRAGGTTCTNTADRSAYWLPSLLVRDPDGSQREVVPTQATVYYHGDPLRPREVRPLPAGLKVVAGRRRPEDPDPGTLVVRWSCEAGRLAAANRPECFDDEEDDGRRPSLRLEIGYPECWDGRRLDSPDHASHLARVGADRRCPPFHPVRLPSIRVFLAYAHPGGPDASTSDAPGAVELSAGGQDTLHADLMNGWDQTTQQRLVVRCLWGEVRC